MPPLNFITRSAIAVAVSQTFLCAQSEAATVTVDNINDAGTGCTLREAILTINAQADQSNGCVVVGTFGSDDEINFDLPDPSTIVLSQPSSLEINNASVDVTIQGSENEFLEIDGNNNSGIFKFTDANVELMNLTLVRGNENQGGGIYASGGELNLVNVTVSSSSAVRGGGIFSTLANKLLLTRSTISNNTASSLGGGIDSNAGAKLELLDSTVNENHSAAYGAGIAAFGEDLKMTNSTVSGNSATYEGGGIYIATSSASSIDSCTISKNQASLGGGLYIRSTDTITVGNSIISGNRTPGPFGAEIVDAFSYIDSIGNNLLGDRAHTDDAAFTNLNFDASDIRATSDGTQPTALSQILAPLGNNGGVTLTHALRATSPARNAGELSRCPIQDQRGQLRDAGDNACDIGSIEFNKADDKDGFIVIPMGNEKVVVIPE